MDTMDIANQAAVEETVPSISRSKQARIDIWRNEVALLTIPDAPESDSPLSPTSSGGPPSTSASSFSRSSSSVFSRPFEESRTRRIWKRLGRKLTGRAGKGREGDAKDAIVRTQMYQAERVDQDAAAKGDDALPDLEDGSEGNGKVGLIEKQERLERAARLLNQGATRDA